MKSYTDINQSKVLATILPLESADMYYECTKEEPEYKVYVGKNIAITYNLFSYRNGHTIPCWSLASLLDVLQYPSLHRTSFGWRCVKAKGNGNIIKIGDYADNPIDACYKLILKLNE